MEDEDRRGEDFDGRSGADATQARVRSGLVQAVAGPRRRCRPQGGRQAPDDVRHRMGRHTILVIEDEPAIRDLAVETLRDAGYDVLQATSGGDAIVIFERCPEIDVIFTDIVMSGIDGFKLADMIK